MTTNDRFDRSLSAWLVADATFRVPDHLDEVLAVTARTRQRPAWSSLERWLPMDTTFRPRLFTFPRAGRLVMVAALILLVLAIAFLAVGSSQRRLPEPFGLARNGVATASSNGDIYALDPVTLERTPLIADQNFDFGGTFSRDGTRILFARSREPIVDAADPSLIVAVADADGTDVRELTEPLKGVDWSDWSPDSKRITFISRETDGARRINVVDVETGDLTSFDVDVPPHFVTWRPPDGQEIMFRAEGDRPALHAIRVADGMVRKISTRPPAHEFDYQSMTVSPDGRTVSFSTWTSDEFAYPSVQMLDIETGIERVLPAPPGTGQRGGATFSPDGATVAYVRIHREAGGAMAEVVVAPADGSSLGRALGHRIPTTPDGGEVPISILFAPDGTAVIVRYGTDLAAEVHWLPVDGSPGRIIDSGSFGFVDIQRLAP
jgi:dipeptidyl aminopeptidase/acylaminoacyl peptidase